MGKGTCYEFVIKYLSENTQPGKIVIETGCGGGLYRSYISEAGGLYIGCDIPNTLYQTDNDVDVFCSSNALPFKDNSCDLIFNQGAFDYMPNPLVTIEEAFRVIRPGGLFTIFTYRKDVLETIDRNCKIRKRSWEINHHTYSVRQLLTWLSNQKFNSKEITAKLDTIQTKGIKRRILDILRIYYFVQSKYSIWRVVEAKKPDEFN